MLKIENISIKYDDKIAIENLTLSLQKGKLHGLAGMNGAGKTSLLNCIYGFVKPYKGKIVWNDQAVKRSSVAYLESTNYFYGWLTGDDYLDLFSAENKNFSREHWNRLFKLPLHQLIESYSSGMKKKLALMGILALEREILLLDEPFNALDLETVELLRKILPGLRDQGKTILITSHILETLTDSCDCIHYLNAGKLEGSYLPGEFNDLHKKLKDLTGSRYDEWIQEAIGNKKSPDQ